jgi:hypothetical protein
VAVSPSGPYNAAPMTARTVLYRLGTFLGIAYLLAGVVGFLWPRWDEAATSDRVVWFVLLAVGGAALLAGLRLLDRSPWAGAALVSVGALAGALALFWSILVPLIAITLVVLSVVSARRVTAATS